MPDFFWPSIPLTVFAAVNKTILIDLIDWSEHIYLLMVKSYAKYKQIDFFSENNNNSSGSLELAYLHRRPGDTGISLSVHWISVQV